MQRITIDLSSVLAAAIDSSHRHADSGDGDEMSRMLLVSVRRYFVTPSL